MKVSPEVTPVQELFAECMKPRYRAPCGVRMNASGQLYAVGTKDLRTRSVITSWIVFAVNTGFMIGFLLLVHANDGFARTPRIVLVFLGCLWGAVIGGLVFVVGSHQTRSADRMQPLLCADDRVIQSPNAGWAMPRETVRSVIAWKVITQDKRAQKFPLRLEFLAMEATDGRLHPILMTMHSIGETRESIRLWCSHHGVALKEYTAFEKDRPWTVDVPHGPFY